MALGDGARAQELFPAPMPKGEDSTDTRQDGEEKSQPRSRWRNGLRVAIDLARAQRDFKKELFSAAIEQLEVALERLPKK